MIFDIVIQIIQIKFGYNFFYYDYSRLVQAIGLRVNTLTNILEYGREVKAVGLCL